MKGIKKSQKSCLAGSLTAVALIAVGILITSCSATPMNVDNVRLTPSTDHAIQLPIVARAEVVLPMGASGDKVDGNLVSAMTLNKAGAVKTAAKEVFGKLFREVDSRGSVNDPHFTIKVRPEANVRKAWGTYNAEVDVKIFYGSGETFGEYQGKGGAMSGFLNDQNALENAYRKAFLKVADDIVSQPDSLAQLKTGVDETHIRQTVKTPNKLESKYADLTGAVVTVFIEGKNANSPYRRGGTAERPHASGFFINGQGAVLTNYHVVENARSISVGLMNGKEYPATIIKTDEWVDLALLQIDSQDTPYLSLNDTPQKYSIGEDVIAIGSPLSLGLDHSVSQGIISSLRMIDGNPVIQTDTAINPGSSGGPLIHTNTKKVIGIVTLGVFGADGIGFALTDETIKGFLEKNGQ